MKRQLSLLIVDDEPHARYLLRKIVETHEAVGVCYEAEDGIQAIKTLDQQACDLVFLDINMPGPNGMTIAAEITARHPAPLIIFMTGHLGYAADAFDLNVVDYVRKGASELRIYRALSKAIQRLALETKNETPSNDHLWAKTDDGDTRLLNTVDIVWAEAKEKKVFVYTNQGEAIEINKTLEKLAALLPAEHFMQVHKSYIVNLLRIKKRVDYSTHAARLLLDNGTEIDVGRNFLPALKSRFPH